MQNFAGIQSAWIFRLALILFSAVVSTSNFIKYTESPVYITGTAKDIGPSLPAVIGNSYIVASLFKAYSIIIYCNKTDIDVLKRSGWLNNDTNVHVIEEGEYPPWSTLPDRLSIGRNKLMAEVRKQMDEKKEDMDNAFLVMMDLDGVIGHIFNRSVLEGALVKNDEWDSVSFNRKRYYDIWALRYKKIDTNCWGYGKDSNRLVKIIMNDITQQLATNDGNQFFPVYSAFNSLAIYKLITTADCEYNGENKEPYVISPNGDCEHVAFHKCMREKNNAKIVIDKHFLSTEASWLPPKPKPFPYRLAFLFTIAGLTLLVVGWYIFKFYFAPKSPKLATGKKSTDV